MSAGTPGKKLSAAVTPISPTTSAAAIAIAAATHFERSSTSADSAKAPQTPIAHTPIAQTVVAQAG
jgi:hypothetical protein